MLDVHDVESSDFERQERGSQIASRGSFGIPYRCLLPQGVSGMLMAGRCVSGSREAQSSFRVMGPCMAMGQAAGTAAAIAVMERIEPRDVDVTLLRRRLTDDAQIVDALERIEASHVP